MGQSRKLSVEEQKQRYPALVAAIEAVARQRTETYLKLMAHEVERVEAGNAIGRPVPLSESPNLCDADDIAAEWQQVFQRDPPKPDETIPFDDPLSNVDRLIPGARPNALGDVALEGDVLAQFCQAVVEQSSKGSGALKPFMDAVLESEVLWDLEWELHRGNDGIEKQIERTPQAQALARRMYQALQERASIIRGLGRLESDPETGSR